MIVVNNYGGQVPEYLNEKFFTDTLEEGYRENGIVLNKICFEVGSNAGDNYCSSIYRVKVNFQRRGKSYAEDVSLIVKSIPITPATQFLEDAGAFMKEKAIYCDVIPRLEILLDNVKLGAKMFYATKEPVQTIVFEDLKELGYKNASRQDMLDFDHAKMLLQRLGQLHASSMVLAKKDPTVREKVKEFLIDETNTLSLETFNKFFGTYLEKFTELVSTWPGYEKITEKLKKCRVNLPVNVLAQTRPRPGEIRVLNHGDIWTSNFMYKYDTQDPTKPVDLTFVDFQLSFYRSPGCDINFFLNSSVQYDPLVNRRDELIELYYESFVAVLKSSKYPTIPTFQELKNEVRVHEGLGFFALFGFLVTITLPPEYSEGSTLESITSEEEGKQRIDRLFSNVKLYKFFKYSLKRFDELGVLDEFSEQK